VKEVFGQCAFGGEGFREQDDAGCSSTNPMDGCGFKFGWVVTADLRQQGFFEEVASWKDWKSGGFGYNKNALVFKQHSVRRGRIRLHPRRSVVGQFLVYREYALGVRDRFIQGDRSVPNALPPVRLAGVRIAFRVKG